MRDPRELFATSRHAGKDGLLRDALAEMPQVPDLMQVCPVYGNTWSAYSNRSDESRKYQFGEITYGGASKADGRGEWWAAVWESPSGELTRTTVPYDDPGGALVWLYGHGFRSVDDWKFRDEPGWLAKDIGWSSNKTLLPRVRGYVYFMSGGGLVKIGHSFSPEDRKRQLETQSPVPLSIIGSMPGSQEDERALHKRFARLRSHGEWFRPGAKLISFMKSEGITE